MWFQIPLAALAFTTSVSASGIVSQDLPDGVLHLSLNGRRSSAKDPFGLKRRDGDISVDLTTPEPFSTELEIGTSGQKVQVQIDISSNDLWVMSPDNPRCGYLTNGSFSGYTNASDSCTLLSCDLATCDASSFFYTNRSSTLTKLDTEFNASYPEEYWAKGFYAQDRISFGGVTLKDAKFAVANETDINYSTWGLGMAESSANTPSILEQMKEEGLVKANAYSLWLSNIDSQNSSLLLGGVDHAKYAGTLQTVPMVNAGLESGGYPELRVMLHGIDLYQDNKTAEVVRCSLPAALRPLEDFMWLPEQLFDSLIHSIGDVRADTGQYLVPCDLSGGLTFDLSGVKISVPFSNLLGSEVGDDESNSCQLVIMPGSHTVTLGSVFLSAVYAVYDLENKEVAFAELAHNVSTSSLEAITSGVPSAVKAPSYSQTQVNSTALTSRATFFQNSLPSLAGTYEALEFITTMPYAYSESTMPGLKALPLEGGATSAASGTRAASASGPRSAATDKSSGARSTHSGAVKQTGSLQAGRKPSASQTTAKQDTSSVANGAKDASSALASSRSAPASSRSATQAASRTSTQNAAAGLSEKRSVLISALGAAIGMLLHLM